MIRVIQRIIPNQLGLELPLKRQTMMKMMKTRKKRSLTMFVETAKKMMKMKNKEIQI